MTRRILLTIGFILAAATTQAAMFNFGCITHNSATDCAIAETQTTLEIVNLGGNQVEFVFSVSGGASMSLAEIYFYDGSLLGIASINDDPGNGVAYYEATTGSMRLPGIGFGPTKAFATVEADNPAPFNGVNPGEQVGIVFDLLAGQTYADVIAALGRTYDPNGNPNQALLIGFHATAFASGGSESLLHGSEVPLPATIWMFGGALAGLLGRKLKA